MLTKETVIVIATLIWKYGDVVVDDDEIEYHELKVSFDDLLNFNYQTLEVMHDDENKTSYYRVRKS